MDRIGKGDTVNRKVPGVFWLIGTRKLRQRSPRCQLDHSFLPRINRFAFIHKYMRICPAMKLSKVVIALTEDILIAACCANLQRRLWPP